MKILCISQRRSRAHFKTGGYKGRDLEIRFECVESAHDNTGFPYSKRLFGSVYLGAIHQAGAEV